MAEADSEAERAARQANAAADTAGLAAAVGPAGASEQAREYLAEAIERGAQGNDAAAFPVAAGRMVLSTDAHVISPLFFPGGDIGALSVHGTINDLAMMGAAPSYLTAAFILEEGLPLRDLDRIVASMAAACREAGVPVVAGDTKVVERGKGDGVFITSTDPPAVAYNRFCRGSHQSASTPAGAATRLISWPLSRSRATTA